MILKYVNEKAFDELVGLMGMASKDYADLEDLGDEADQLARSAFGDEYGADYHVLDGIMWVLEKKGYSREATSSLAKPMMKALGYEFVGNDVRYAIEMEDGSYISKITITGHSVIVEMTEYGDQMDFDEGFAEITAAFLRQSGHSSAHVVKLYDFREAKE